MILSSGSSRRPTTTNENPRASPFPSPTKWNHWKPRSNGANGLTHLCLWWRSAPRIPATEAHQPPRLGLYSSFATLCTTYWPGVIRFYRISSVGIPPMISFLAISWLCEGFDTCHIGVTSSMYSYMYLDPLCTLVYVPWRAVPRPGVTYLSDCNGTPGTGSRQCGSARPRI